MDSLYYFHCDYTEWGLGLSWKLVVLDQGHSHGELKVLQGDRSGQNCSPPENNRWYMRDGKQPPKPLITRTKNNDFLCYMKNI